MSIIRTDKNRNYTSINNTCFQDPQLSARAKGIFAYIMTLPDSWAIYKSEIYSHFAEGRQAIDTAFKELEKFGYIAKTPKRGIGGKLSGWDFTVYETPQTLQETDLRETDSPENRNTVNPQLVSTNSVVSTKEEKKNTKKVSEYSTEFKEFWKLYEMKGSKKTAFAQWKKLDHNDMTAALNSLEYYFLESPEKKYRKDAERFIRDRLFESVMERAENDCLIIPRQQHQTNQPPSDDLFMHEDPEAPPENWAVDQRRLWDAQQKNGGK